MACEPRAVVLLSGGLDSATTLALARAAGFECYALTVRYGQRHAVEIEAARRVARAMGVARHVELEIDLRAFGGSALTSDQPVPKDRTDDAMAKASRSLTCRPAIRFFCRSHSPGPRRWVHSTSGSASIASITRAIPIAGRNSFDRSRRWPTWRPGPGSKRIGRFRIHAPLLTLNKEQIIERGRALGVDYSLTHSCYDPSTERAFVRPVRCVPDPPVGVRAARDSPTHSPTLRQAEFSGRSPVDPLVTAGRRAGFLVREVRSSPRRMKSICSVLYLT